MSMSIEKIVRDAMAVPGKVSPDELGFLARLAKTVPRNGVAVEVGPLFGRSTRAIAMAANQSTVYSIDTWQTAPWIENFRSKIEEERSFGLDTFRFYTKDCTNVIPIQGFSPRVVQDWREPIDFYFEDATHGNPGLNDNLIFWLSHLKAGGIICGHDYTIRFPDVKREVDSIATSWRTRPEIIGSLWALRKPVGEAPSPGLLSSLPQPPPPQLELLTKNKLKGFGVHASSTWAGAHLEPDRLLWVAIRWLGRLPGLDIQYRLGHPEFGETTWTKSGQKCRLVQNDKVRPAFWFAARLTGREACRFSLRYQCGYRQIGNGGQKVSGLSDWTADGEWATARTPGAPISSMRVDLLRR